MSTTPKPPNLEKELARKLAWAIISTLDPSAHHKRRTRVWAWRVACKIVAAKDTFHIDKRSPPPDNGMAGGGAVGVTRREAHLKGTQAARYQEERDASTPSQSNDDVRGRPGSQASRGTRVETACTGGSCRRRGGLSCLRRPAGCDDGWRCWFEAETAPKTGADG